ncbi:MAG: PGPGW domain-containing protein [Desulfurivibrionaceae bacterium]|nr:PGPGW domain-containing protein [Desulfurivibrionaceae bacterium]
MLPQALHELILAHETLLWWLAGASLFLFIGTLFLVPILVVRLPSDYFTHPKRHPLPWGHHHSFIRAILLFGKNILGSLFLVTGFLMLFLPGQGLLTMVMGIVLLDLPVKYRLQRWLISRGPILRAINWLRRRAGRPLLRVDKSRHRPSSDPP